MQCSPERPPFAEIVEELKKSPDLVFPGTDIVEYRKYQERLESERLENARPVELVDALYSIVGWDKDDE
jgi:hypothetical protein